MALTTSQSAYGEARNAVSKKLTVSDMQHLCSGRYERRKPSARTLSAQPTHRNITTSHPLADGPCVSLTLQCFMTSTDKELLSMMQAAPCLVAPLPMLLGIPTRQSCVCTRSRACMHGMRSHKVLCLATLATACCQRELNVNVAHKSHHFRMAQHESVDRMTVMRLTTQALLMLEPAVHHYHQHTASCSCPQA